jgi:hypothetical protein
MYKKRSSVVFEADIPVHMRRGSSGSATMTVVLTSDHKIDPNAGSKFDPNAGSKSDPNAGPNGSSLSSTNSSTNTLRVPGDSASYNLPMPQCIFWPIFVQ